jgi:hypothetical protein
VRGRPCLYRRHSARSLFPLRKLHIIFIIYSARSRTGVFSMLRLLAVFLSNTVDETCITLQLGEFFLREMRIIINSYVRCAVGSKRNEPAGRLPQIVWVPIRCSLTCWCSMGFQPYFSSMVLLYACTKLSRQNCPDRNCE